MEDKIKMLIALLAINLVASNACAQSSFQSISTSTNEPPSSAAAIAGWPVTEGRAGGGRYAPLTDINRDNVATLKIAWTYRHGDFESGGSLPDKFFKGSAFECTPILVEGRLIFTTPFNRVIALDPETGRELWTFDPRIDKNRRFANMLINRGVAYWRDVNAESAGAGRVFIGTLDARLIAIEVKTGKPCRDFDKNGTVNLLERKLEANRRRECLVDDDCRY